MFGSAWFLAFMVFVAVERVWETRASGRALRGKKAEAWSLPALFVVHCLVLLAVTTEFLWRTPDITPWVTAAGLVLFSGALGLRLWAIRALGGYWSLHVEMRPDQPLITSGPYRFVRHPAYLGTFLEFIGVPLVGNCYWSLLLVFLVYFPLLGIRLRTEEKVLERTFGASYRAYKDRVNGLLPFRFLPKH